jgi:shikimate kinase
MHLKLKRTPGIFLAGFMGSGKSTVGSALADRLGWEFVDLDAEIEAAEKEPITVIFDTRGEAEFRRLESAALCAHIKRIERGNPEVVALGGGAFVEAANFAQISSHGISVWIDCPIEIIRERLAEGLVNRPNARDPQRFVELYESRREGYAKADFRVDGSLPLDAVVDAIADLPLWK